VLPSTVLDDPHFEKVLYDSGRLLANRAQAAVATGDPLFRRVTRETADWIRRDLEHSDGGYYSTLDADSEGHEGRFYVWTPDEVRPLLDEREYAVLSGRFGLDRAANFEQHWHLHAFEPLTKVAEAAGLIEAAAGRASTGARSCWPCPTGASGAGARREDPHELERSGDRRLRGGGARARSRGLPGLRSAGRGVPAPALLVRRPAARRPQGRSITLSRLPR
jgi:hypothetical protein